MSDQAFLAFPPPPAALRCAAALCRARRLWLLPLLVAAALALTACQGEKEDTGSEGTNAAPVAITLGVAVSGTVGKAPASSFYAITAGVTGLTTYIISLSSLGDDVDLAVFTDAGFSVPFCASSHNSTAAESCSAQTDNSASALYIQAKSFSATGTTYLITIN